MQKCQRLEEENSRIQNDSRELVELLRLQLDDQVQKTVLAEEKNAEVAEQLVQCTKVARQWRDELEAKRQVVEALEAGRSRQHREARAVLDELVKLREQMLQERMEYNEQKKQMIELKMEHAKLQENLRITTAERESFRMRVVQDQNRRIAALPQTHKRNEELREYVEKKFAEILLEKLRESRTELTPRQEELQGEVNQAMQTTVGAVTSELFGAQLEEQQKKIDAAEAKAADWRRKCLEAQNKLKLADENHASRSEKERSRRKKLNKKLLGQSKVLDGVRQELDTYRKLVEGLDLDGSLLSECPGITTPEGVAGRPRSPGSPLRQLQLASGTPNSTGQRTNLLRRALTARSSPLTGNTDSPSEMRTK